MNLTRHAYKRMNERCIQQALIDIALKFGSDSGDGEKVILDKKTITTMMSTLSGLLQQLEKLKGRGGLTIVEVNEMLITAYYNNSFDVKKRKTAMKNITINEEHFGQGSLGHTKSTPTKLNIKINKVDLAILDELAALTDDTRSQVVNAAIEALVYKFFNQDVENFDTRYLLASEADKRNPELNNSLSIDKSWLYEIDPNGQIGQVENKYYQQQNFYSQEHDDIKSILSSSVKK